MKCYRQALEGSNDVSPVNGYRYNEVVVASAARRNMASEALRIDQENLQILRDLSLLQIHRRTPSR